MPGEEMQTATKLTSENRWHRNEVVTLGAGGRLMRQSLVCACKNPSNAYLAADQPCEAEFGAARPRGIWDARPLKQWSSCGREAVLNAARKDVAPRLQVALLTHIPLQIILHAQYEASIRRSHFTPTSSYIAHTSLINHVSGPTFKVLPRHQSISADRAISSPPGAIQGPGAGADTFRLIRPFPRSHDHGPPSVPGCQRSLHWIQQGARTGW